MAVEGWLSDSAEWFGYFWPPGEQANARAGVLTYSPEKGLSLRLIGGFDSRVHSVIHGASDRKPVTLLDCSALGTTFRNGELTEQIIDAEMALIGVHLHDGSEQSFSAVDVELENLSAWAVESDIDLNFKWGTTDDGTPQRAGWGIRVTPAESRTAGLNDLKTELYRRYGIPSDNWRRDRVEVETFATSVLRFESTNPRGVGEWLETVRVAQDLLSLSMHFPCAVLRQTLIPTDDLKEADKTARSEISVYTRQIVHPDRNAAAVSSRDMLFTLFDAEFPDVLRRWFAIQEQFTATCNMVLGLKYIPEGYLETKVITAAGAAEAMHRALKPPPPIPRKEFKDLRKWLLACTPEDRRKWLEQRLAFNEPTLRDRLLDLASRLDPEVMRALLPNPEEWARATTKARNDIAHRGQFDRAKLNEGVAVVEVTVAVVIVNLLHRLGLARSRILRAAQDNSDLSSAAILAHRHWPAG